VWVPGGSRFVKYVVKKDGKKGSASLINGEFTVKRFYQQGGQTWLQAENPQYAPIILCEGQELEIWGVVSHVVHKP
jgi:SOS-response transcriptional repressor LexA